MSIDERAEISLTSGRWRCGAFSRGYASFCEVSRDSVRGRIEAEKIFFPPCKYFARMGIVLYVSDTEKTTYETKPRKEQRYVWINRTCNNIDRNHSSRLRHRFCHCLRYGKLRNRKPREGKRTKGENAMVPFITGIMCAGIAISTLFM